MIELSFLERAKAEVVQFSHNSILLTLTGLLKRKVSFSIHLVPADCLLQYRIVFMGTTPERPLKTLDVHFLMSGIFNDWGVQLL